MTNADTAARLTAALDEAAAREAGQIVLASLSMEVLAPGDAHAIETSVLRKTRTLLFLNAEAKNETGGRIATASAVYKIIA